MSEGDEAAFVLILGGYPSNRSIAPLARLLMWLGMGQADAIAILGGTGDQGLGLALRFAKAGRTVVIGSRKTERAVAAAEEVRAAVPARLRKLRRVLRFV